MKKLSNYLWVFGMIFLSVMGAKEIEAGFNEIKLNKDFLLYGLEVDASLVSYHHVPKPKKPVLFASYGDQPILTYEDASNTVHEYIATEYGFIAMGEKTSFAKQKFKVTYLSSDPSMARVMSKYVSSEWQRFSMGLLLLVMSAAIGWRFFRDLSRR